jgi:hypothetical protein
MTSTNNTHDNLGSDDEDTHDAENNPQSYDAPTEFYDSEHVSATASPPGEQEQEQSDDDDQSMVYDSLAGDDSLDDEDSRESTPIREPQPRHQERILTRVERALTEPDAIQTSHSFLMVDEEPDSLEPATPSDSPHRLCLRLVLFLHTATVYAAIAECRPLRHLIQGSPARIYAVRGIRCGSQRFQTLSTHDTFRTVLRRYVHGDFAIRRVFQSSSTTDVVITLEWLFGRDTTVSLHCTYPHQLVADEEELD